MRGPAAAALFAVFRTEVLLNTKRVVPYAMLALFAGNALLWWGWGPAGHHGWATNSEYIIVSSLTVYSFMTLPLFTAVIMGDPVVRDFRAGVAPLIFSKPLGRAEYLEETACGPSPDGGRIRRGGSRHGAAGRSVVEIAAKGREP